MSIDPRNLSPEAQAQIARKIALQRPKGKSKYHNTPAIRKTSTGKEIRFDSKREAERYDELMAMLRAGKIRNLKLQPVFTLQEAFTTPEGERVRARTYVADFFYEIVPEPGEMFPAVCNPWMQGIYVVEDVKGHKTRAYLDKRKEMLQRGIEIREV